MYSNDKGTNWFTRYILKCLGKEKCEELEYFTSDIPNQDFLEFISEDQVYDILNDIVRDYIENLTVSELADLRFYTGYDFRNINNTMRGKWNYEENGLLTNEKKDKFKQLGESIYEVIKKFPPININMKAYRGVSIRAFFDYNIHSLEDLKSMEGQYIYESGFSSTSLLRSYSFFEKELGWGDWCNIEIEYYIPGSCQDGAVLLSDVLSYSKGQIEYVINSGSLTKITNVDVDTEHNRAFLKAVLIPRRLWDPNQLKEEKSISK